MSSRKEVYFTALDKAAPMGQRVGAEVQKAIAELHLQLHDAEADRDIYKNEFLKVRAKLRALETKWAKVAHLQTVKRAVRRKVKK